MKCYLDMDRLAPDGTNVWHGYDFSTPYNQDYYIEFNNRGQYTLFQKRFGCPPETPGTDFQVISEGHYERFFDGVSYRLVTKDGVEGKFLITKPLAADRELGECGECVLE